jgi:hypothetical protein
MSVLTSVGVLPAQLGTGLAGTGYSNNKPGGLATVQMPLQLRSLAASGGSLMNNIYQVPPQVTPSTVSRDFQFERYAARYLADRTNDLNGTAMGYRVAANNQPEILSTTPAAVVAPSAPLAAIVPAVVAPPPPINVQTYAPQFTTDLARTQPGPQQSQGLPFVRRTAPVFEVFPQSVPFSAVGAAMLQNAASVTGQMQGSDGPYQLNVSSLWSGANIRPLFYATPVGFGMTRTCDCVGTTCPRPCNYGQPWRF